jgi:hypothetical protein
VEKRSAIIAKSVLVKIADFIIDRLGLQFIKFSINPSNSKRTKALNCKWIKELFG